MDGSRPIEQVVAGRVFTEGPIWMDDGSLWFSDIPADQLWRWHPETGAELLRTPNNKGNGMTRDNQGRLVVCEHATSAVTRRTGDGMDREPLATHHAGVELNSPNDVVVARDGSILFTDPSFGRTLADMGVLRDVPQPHRGVYHVPPDGGEPELLVADMAQPNGLCLAPDESVLYVGDTVRAHIRAFRYDGGAAPFPLADAGVFASGISEVDTRDDNYVDGLKVDELGNVYVTGPGGVWVYASDGAWIGVIEVPEPAANLNWGGPDWRSLFITATTSVYRVRMRVAGHRLGYMR
ncbi:SMP-30/gluconolactonase/LRE family protein [Nocardioides sp. NPDC092400]|uniref:SMP-30/gluconolactonase/LRE family protein n=1 Tax=Nocardioides sp. NPDC092400 TaxID=3155196 RepID=UPI00343376F2